MELNLLCYKLKLYESRVWITSRGQSRIISTGNETDWPCRIVLGWKIHVVSIGHFPGIISTLSELFWRMTHHRRSRVCANSFQGPVSPRQSRHSWSNADKRQASSSIISKPDSESRRRKMYWVNMQTKFCTRIQGNNAFVIPTGIEGRTQLKGEECIPCLVKK